MKTRQQMMNEAGRSMVEMLGVLAIIGVLSVGGIYGYTIAMNKHKANELLHEASKRAVIVADQLVDKEKASLSEFAGQMVPGGTFANETEIVPQNGQFSLMINEVSKGVCEQMENIAGGMVQKFEADCDYGTIRLTFNKDLGTGTGTDSGASANTLADQIAAVLNNESCNGDCPEGIRQMYCSGQFATCNIYCSDGTCSDALKEAISQAVMNKYGWKCTTEIAASDFDCGPCPEHYPDSPYC